LLLVGSYAFGFVLVVSFYRPVVTPAPVVVQIPRVDSGAPDGGVCADRTSEAVQSADFHEGEAPPEVPPGRTPRGVVIADAPRYLKCWDQGGTLHRFPACDSLELLEKRLGTRLYVLDRCKRRHAGDEAEGELSLGMQVDFAERAISFWSGPSSTVEEANAIGTCVRRDLAGLPIHEIEHKFERYVAFFTVIFRDPERLEQELRQKRRRGRVVDVVKDHVRMRKEPVNGYVFGKISSGNSVHLLEKKNEWCRVITPGDREGWMICDALDL
jgi:hypothetical protein